MLTFATVSAASPDAPSGYDDPVQAAAKDLHQQFLAEMLKQAKLTQALSGSGGGNSDANLAAALASTAIDRIAADMADSQPGFTDKLYRALMR